MTRLTTHKVRALTPARLDIDLPTVPASTQRVSPSIPELISPAVLSTLEDDDPLLLIVDDLLSTWGGVLFTGPPGTSKSHFAEQIALHLAGAEERVKVVQFHPSYQYEDFMEGYAPTGNGVYKLTDKHFVLACKAAAADPDHRHFIVIDELSRSDPGRVFGEALTYIERSKRGKTFLLSSGKPLTVPTNLEILATMNPQDKGVDEVDAALNRRFAKYEMPPSADFLSQFLLDAGMPESLRDGVLAFFNLVNSKQAIANNPYAALGHTYFAGVKNASDLTRLWEYQLRFHFDQAYRLDPDGLAAVQDAWDKMLTTPEQQSQEQDVVQAVPEGNDDPSNPD